MARIVLMSMRATMHLFDKIDDKELLHMATKEELIVNEFSDGEIAVKPANSIRGAHVYLLGANGKGNTDELMMTLDSLQRSSVKSVTLILPYYGYSRQDKRLNTRGSNGAKAMANLIESYSVVKKLVVADIHADQIRGFFNIPVENIEGHAIFRNTLEQIITPNTVVTAPDAGGIKRAEAMAEKLGVGMVQMSKHRAKANEVDSMILIGDVKDKDVLIVDDMGDTLGTMEAAVKELKSKGAKMVFIAFTHAVLSGRGPERLGEIPAYFLMSDTIALDPNYALDGSWGVRIISCVPVLEKVIRNLIHDGSLSFLND